MSTEQLEQEAPAEGEEQEEEQAGERDWESDARAMGWSPEEEFKGDKKQWIDAKTFVERGEQMMPILKAQNKALLKRISGMEKTINQARDFFSKSEQRGYDRAMAEIKARQREAVRTGDEEAFEAAEKDLNDLQKDGNHQVSQADTAEAFISFKEENEWYDGESRAAKLATEYADAVGRKTPLDKSSMGPNEYFEWIAEQVKERYSDRYPELFGLAQPKPKPRSPVEAPSNVRPRAGTKTAADLDAVARRQGESFVKMGLFKDLNAYAKDYFANGG